MNREFLKSFDLTDEVIDKIMAENGNDIETAKGKATEYKEQLDKANETIKSLEESKGNIEELQKQLDAYKEAEAKRTEAEKAAQANAAMLSRFESVVGDGKFLNEFTKNGIFEEFKKAVSDEANKGKGDSEIYAAMIKDRDGIFVNPNAPKDITGSAHSIDVEEIDEAAARAVMGLPAK